MKGFEGDSKGSSSSSGSATTTVSTIFRFVVVFVFGVFVFGVFVGVRLGVRRCSGSVLRTSDSSAMNNALCAHPAYGPKTSSMRRSTARMIFGVTDLASLSSGA